LYTEGLRDSPDLPDDFEFKLVNPATLKELNDYAADLVRRVDDGTKFYMKRLIVSGVDQGLSSPKIAQMIRDGATVDEVLRSAEFTDEVIGTVKAELESLSEYRSNSIVNTEINRAESRGRLGQWRAMGLTKKGWAHTGPDTPCKVCTGNIGLGLVDIDYEFEDVFGGTQTPPGHPGVCHCHLEFDEAELIGKADEVEVWDGQ